MFAGLNFWPSGAFGSDCAATSASARFAIGSAKPAFAATSMNFRRDKAPEKRSSNRLLIVPSSVTRPTWFAQVYTSLPRHERSMNHVRHTAAANGLDRKVHVLESEGVCRDLLQREAF